MGDFDDAKTAETPEEYRIRHEYKKLTPWELKNLLQEKLTMRLSRPPI